MNRVNRAGVLRLPADMRIVVETEALSAYPHECCGILFGQDISTPEGKVRQIVRVLPVANAWDDVNERERRFSIDPKQLMAAEKFAEAMGVSVIGFFHSHPSGDAAASEFDRQAAWPVYSYIIIGVTAFGTKEIKSWRLSDDSSHWIEEAIVVT